MDHVLAALVGVFATVGIYLMLSRTLVRMLLGLVVLGNGVNLLILVAGRTGTVPPIVPDGQGALSPPFANPLPQALILTAIVIGFAFFAFLLVLAFRAGQDLDTDDSDRMRVAEPEGGPFPPLSY